MPDPTNGQMTTMRQIKDPDKAYYPNTFAQGVFDSTIGRFQNAINRMSVTLGDEEITGEAIPVIADQLQGFTAAQLAKQADLDILNKDRGYLNTATPTITDIHTLRYNGKFVLQSSGVSNMPPITDWYHVESITSNGGLNVCLTATSINLGRKFTCFAVNDYWTPWREITTIDQICNPDILDNPWFGKGVINQNALTVAAAQNTDLCDRWRIYTHINGTATLTDTGVVLSGRFDYGQKFESSRIPNTPNTVLTASVLLSDGSVLTNTFTLTNNGAQETYRSTGSTLLEVTVIRRWFPEIDLFMLSPIDSTVSVIAAKLELGNVSTIKNVAPPNPQQELAKCQRYLQEITRAHYTHLCTLHKGFDENTAYGIINLPTSMRIVPTLVSGTFYAFNAGTTIECTITILPYIQNNGISIAATPKAGQPGFTKDTWLLCSNGTTPIVLSAEL